MTESVVSLELRHFVLAERAPLRPASVGEGEQGVFIALDEPPPVRTVLTVVDGDERRPLSVVRVVEVPDQDGENNTRGLVGRWIDAQALEAAQKVGAEHLEDGTPVVQPVIRDHSVAMDVSDAPAMAMPAPVVVVDDDTGVVDLEPGASEDADSVAQAAESYQAGHEAAPEDDSAPATAAADDAGATADDTSDSEATADDSADQRNDPEDAADAAEDSSSSPESSESPSRGGRKKRGRRRR